MINHKNQVTLEKIADFQKKNTVQCGFFSRDLLCLHVTSLVVTHIFIRIAVLAVSSFLAFVKEIRGA